MRITKKVVLYQIPSRPLQVVYIVKARPKVWNNKPTVTPAKEA